MSDNTEKPFHQGTANLIPPVKGEIRNPKGKPKGTRNRATIVREMLEAAAADALKSKLDIGFQPTTIFEQLVATAIVKASLGDMQALNYLTDSGFGKLTDKLETAHTVTMMGKVTAQPVGAPPDAPVKELEFDIGDPPLIAEGEVNENDPSSSDD